MWITKCLKRASGTAMTLQSLSPPLLAAPLAGQRHDFTRELERRLLGQ
jgi:hypothetical protein